MNKIKPKGNRVLIKPESFKETKHGIILPDEDKPVIGAVVDAGNVTTVKPGDRVIFSRYGFDEIVEGPERFYLVSEPNIIAVYEK